MPSPAQLQPHVGISDVQLQVVAQRMRRAAFIAAENLSASEALYIPLDFDPTPETTCE